MNIFDAIRSKYMEHMHCQQCYRHFSLILLLFILLTACGTSTSSQQPVSAHGTPSMQETASISSFLYYQTPDALYRVDMSSGKIGWTAMFAPFGTNVTHNQAKVSNGVVYAESTGSDGYYIYAFDALHGTLRWKYRYGGDELQGESGDSPSKVLIGQGTVYLVVGTDALASVGPQYPQGNTQVSPIPPISTILYKLDAATGHLLWQHHLSYRLNMPLLAGNTLYGIGSTTFHGSLEALNGDDGSLLWQHQLPQSNAHYGNLTFNSGVLYSMALNMNSTLALFAFSALNGKNMWNSDENVTGASMSTIGIGPDALYFVANYHQLYTFSSQDGKFLWQRTFSVFLDNSNLFVSNKMLYLATQNSPDPSPLTLYTLDSSTGQTRWSHPLSSNDATFSQIEISQKLLYVVTLDGTQGPVRMSRYDSLTSKLVGTYILPSSVSAPTVAGKVTLIA